MRAVADSTMRLSTASPSCSRGHRNVVSPWTSALKQLARAGAFFAAAFCLAVSLGQPIFAATTTVTVGPVTAGPETFQAGLPVSVILPSGYLGTPTVMGTRVTFAIPNDPNGPILLAVTSIDVLSGGSLRLHFKLPSLGITSPTSYLFGVKGRSDVGSFASSPAVSISVLPNIQLNSVSPSSGQAGQVVDVTLTGSNTSFVNGSTTAAFGPGISVNGAAAGAAGIVTVGSATSAVAHLTIAAGATPGARAVTVKTGNQQVSLNPGFNVQAATQPPVANAGGPYSGRTAANIAFTAAASTDPGGLTLTYAWTFGDGGTSTSQTPTHSYAVAGNYAVSLQVTNSAGLSNTANTTATITDPSKPPTASAGGPYSGTTNVAIAFSAAASSDPGGLALTYTWNFGDGTPPVAGVAPSHTYAKAGVYTVTLTATNTANLSNTATTTATVKDATQAPVANAGGPYTGNAGTAIAFSGAASSDPKGETLSYAWNFGDGSTSSGVAPSHTYTSAGTYTVSLTVTNTDNLSATATAKATVAALQPPLANAGGPYTGTAGVAVAFSGAGSSDPKNESLTYAWDFGDGALGTGVAPHHTYAIAGNYKVSLTATNTDNLTASSSTTATISAPAQAPVANAGGPYSGTAGVSVAFSGAASTDPKNETLSYAWTFGDGSSGTGVAPAHVYAAPGSYTVSLTITNTDSLTSTATAKVTIAAPAPQPPVASAGGPYTGVTGTAVSFNGTASTDPKAEALSYAWSFGDSSTGSGATPAHVYTTAGVYSVLLTVTNTDGLSANTSGKATITAPVQPPVASVGGPYSGTAGSLITFDGSASSDPTQPGSGPASLSYAWSFGDGSHGAGPYPAHTYATAGTYTVSVSVQSPSGGSASASTTATIAAGNIPAGAPHSNPGGPYSGALNTPIAFTGSGSSDPNGLALTYGWSFGDGTSSALANPTHSYATPGTFSAQLSVSNGTTQNANGTSVTIAPAAPPPALVASAGGPYSVAVNQPLVFDGTQTTNPSHRQLTYAWDFGDGSTGTSSGPSHTYTASGKYSIVMNVTDGAFSSGTATAQVTVTGAAAETVKASAGGPYADTTGHAITFDASASNDNLSNPLTYSWTFGDGTTGTGATPTHAYSTAGSFTATVTASSGATSASASAAVKISTALTVSITSPVANTVFGTNTVTVSGTISQPNLTVTVNGLPATVSGTSFSATGVSLREGVTLITATATDGKDGIGTGSVSVILDATAPMVSITSPANGAVLTSPSITVAGLVNDIVTGTIGSNDVTVTVNGVPAQVANRSYALNGVVLVPGSNTVTVVVTDKVGNKGQATATVQLAPPTAQLLLLALSGNGQTAPINTVLAQPLMVQLQAADGTPVVGRPVTFAVTRSDGTVEVMPTMGQSLFVNTDQQGKAAVLFQVGSRSGLGVNQVTVSTPGAAGTVLFTASSTASAPSQIHAVRGENQRGLLGEALAEALQVIVADAAGNPLPGVTVTYAVTAGDGKLDHQNAITDSNGKAVASLTLGQQEGSGNYMVSATFAGNPGVPVIFAASGFAPAPVANTSVSGVVLDNANTPIPNATVRIAGTVLSTVTDTNGRFLIAGAPVGTVSLSVDGSTSTRPETFPFLSFVLQDLPGQNNTLNKPIYLPSININNAQTVGGDDPVTLTMTGVPGLAFTIAPHSVTFPDGSTVGKLSLSQVKSDMVPMSPTSGTGPDLIWTLQPAGARFSIPVKVTLPNTQGLAPGYVSEIYQYDHDLEQFVSAGTGHVSPDGSVIVSDPGFGITKAGWGHGPVPPLPPNCTYSCVSHNICIGLSGGGCSPCTESFFDGRSCGKPSPSQCKNPGICQGGVCGGGNKPDMTACDDGLYCTEKDMCAGGVCQGKKIEDVDDPVKAVINELTKVDYNFRQVVNPVLYFFNRFGVGFQSITPSFTPTFGTDKLACCEAKKQMNVPKHTDSISGGLKLSAPPIPFPPPYSVYVPGLGYEGFTVQLDGAITGTVSETVDQCENQDCWSGTIALDVTVAGVITANVGFVNVSTSLGGGIHGDVMVDCKQIRSTIGTTDFKATGTIATMPFGFSKSINAVLIPAQVFASITVPF